MKKLRQVIANKNTVTFASGAIENPIINKQIVDVLEGTYPAFHNRDCKYIEKLQR